jgi:hypothetical protein
MECNALSEKSVNLSLYEEMLEKTRASGINMSAFLEIRLQGYLALIKGGDNTSTLREGFQPTFKVKFLEVTEKITRIRG